MNFRSSNYGIVKLKIGLGIDWNSMCVNDTDI